MESQRRLQSFISVGQRYIQPDGAEGLGRRTRMKAGGFEDVHGNGMERIWNELLFLRVGARRCACRQ